MDHGGVLSTAGGIVIQGSVDGRLRVFNDETGAVLKEIDTGSPLIAAPMSYTVNGVQYVAILAGSGGGGWNVWMPETSRRSAATTTASWCSGLTVAQRRYRRATRRGADTAAA